MVRRRSCFSCGTQQLGTGACCSSCGKPVDVPELEMLSGNVAADDGTDVVLAPSSSRLRSFAVIGAVIAALAMAAALSARDTAKAASSTSTPATLPPSSSTPSTSSLAQQRAANPSPDSTTTTVPTTEFTPAPTTTTTVRSIQLQTPVLPGETTGAKLVLLNTLLHGPASDVILDVDAGTVTRLATHTIAGDGSQVQRTASGLVYNSALGSMVRVFLPSGEVREFSPPDAAGTGRGTIIDNTLWTVNFGPQGDRAYLASIDLTTGAVQKWGDLPLYGDVIGADAQHRPLVSFYQAGTYSFDPATQQFVRLTGAFVLSTVGLQRLETRCDARLSCNIVSVPLDEVENVAQATGRVVAGFSVQSGGAELSPDGQHVVVTTRTRLGASIDVVSLVAPEPTSIHLATTAFDNASISFGWTADGKWLFFLHDANLWAWRDGWAAPRTILLDDGAHVSATAVGVFPPGSPGSLG